MVCCFAIQDRDIKTFQEMMSSAVQFRMRKVLACCEHTIASDNTGKFNEMLQTVPSESFVRIVECLRQKSYRSIQLSPEKFLELP